MGNFIDLTGQKFGRLTVIDRAPNRGNRGHRVAWNCVCACGNSIIALGYELRTGHTASCGCLQRERTGNANRKHGDSSTRLNRIWRGIKSRCDNPHDTIFHRYGGRGITICPEWRDSFEAFRKWALSHGYNDSLTIDRIDVNGPYCPENCRWASYAEQAVNKRNNVVYKGKSLSEWAKELHVEAWVFRNRLRRGWPIEEAIFTPLKRQVKRRGEI